jgi:hypothetical protein
VAAVEVVDCVPLISVHSLNEHNSPASFLLNIKEASQIWKGEKVLKQYDITRNFDSLVDTSKGSPSLCLSL